MGARYAIDLPLDEVFSRIIAEDLKPENRHARYPRVFIAGRSYSDHGQTLRCFEGQIEASYVRFDRHYIPEDDTKEITWVYISTSSEQNEAKTLDTIEGILGIKPSEVDCRRGLDLVHEIRRADGRQQRSSIRNL